MSTKGCDLVLQINNSSKRSLPDFGGGAPHQNGLQKALKLASLWPGADSCPALLGGRSGLGGNTGTQAHFGSYCGQRTGRACGLSCNPNQEL